MKIRDAATKDLKEIAKLNMMLDKYESKWFPFPEVNLKKSYTWIRAHFKSKKSKIFVAIEDGKIVGYILGWLDKWAYHQKINKFGYCSDCFVLQKYRGRGVCRALTQKLIDWFESKNMKYTTLMASYKNKSGEKAWEALGYKKFCIIMEKKIK